MKKENKKTIPPIKDGWIELEPGAKVAIDERLSKIWNTKKEEIKELRGKVLAICIQIELEVDSLFRHLFFPEHLLETKNSKSGLRVDDLSSLFLYEIVKGLGFNNKCRILKSLSSQHKLLKSTDCIALLKKLDKIRKIRNLFAHSAVSFIPVGSPPNQTLRKEGYSEGKRTIIDQKYIADGDRLFLETIHLLEVLNKKVSLEK